jgi:anaerobic magnesium-protoporphyrin IX monomethyl ester cyclase
MLTHPRVLLLHPYNPLEGYHYAVPQVALGYLSHALKANGFSDVHVKDAHLFRWDKEEVLNYIMTVKPTVLGIRVWSHQVGVVNEYIRLVRESLPGIKIVVGGPHMTVAPGYLSQNPAIDFGIAGEAEDSLVQLLKYWRGEEIPLPSIPGLVWRDEASIRQNPMAREEALDKYRVDWDSLDLPSYHGLNERTTAYDHGDSKNAFLFTTRGCPYPCTYCAAGITNGKKIRSLSAARALEDLEYLYNKYGVRHFNIMDDNFTFYKDHVMDFCEGFLKIADRVPGVTFHNPNGVRVDRLDDEMLAIMKRCGWKWLHIGIESGSKSTLLKMKKRLDLDIAMENISKIRKHGIKVWGFFILGYKGETRQEMEDTIRFALDSKLNAASFSIFSPIPGTAVYKELEAAGELQDQYLMSGYMSAKGKVYADGVSAEEIQGLLRSALIRFYMRPDRAYWLLKDMSWSTFSNRVRSILLPKYAPLEFIFGSRNSKLS